jgi:hypothetical protein
MQFVDLRDDDIQSSSIDLNLASIRRNPFTKLHLGLPFGIEPADSHRRGTGALNMLRVTVVESSSSSVRLRVEGRLTGRSIEELRDSCELHSLADGIRLTLDLGDVSFADADGIELLRQLRGRDVTILNLVPYLALRLRVAESRDEPPRNDGDVSDGD